MHAFAPQIAVNPAAGRAPAQPDLFESNLTALRRELVQRAHRLTGDLAAAEDLVQEVYERALVCRGRFQPGTNLRAWLASIQRNLFLDQCRRRTLCLQSGGDWAEAAPAEAPAFSPFELLDEDDFMAALGSLDESDRKILRLALFDRVTYVEIAAEMGLALRTTGTRLHRAKARLRKRLTAIYESRLENIGELGAGVSLRDSRRATKRSPHLPPHVPQRLPITADASGVARVLRFSNA
jgi:RNA polymerase sigma-70 factor (ECF subfamily)